MRTRGRSGPLSHSPTSLPETVFPGIVLSGALRLCVLATLKTPKLRVFFGVARCLDRVMQALLFLFLCFIILVFLASAAFVNLGGISGSFGAATGLVNRGL